MRCHMGQRGIHLLRRLSSIVKLQYCRWPVCATELHLQYVNGQWDLAVNAWEIYWKARDVFISICARLTGRVRTYTRTYKYIHTIRGRIISLYYSTEIPFDMPSKGSNQTFFLFSSFPSLRLPVFLYESLFLIFFFFRNRFCKSQVLLCSVCDFPNPI